MNKKQISLMQQALWKLQDAHRLVAAACGDSDSGQLLVTAIIATMEDIESDIAESSLPV